MAGVQDFRSLSFSRIRVEACGRFLGHRAYWKLYAIENLVRVILHSVLSAQIGAGWLNSSLDRKKKQDIERMKRDYLKRPTSALPGRHDVYYLFLSDLSKILLANQHLVKKVIPDVDKWVVKLEGVRIPRNLVGHMNFPSKEDRESIDVLHEELSVLIDRLSKTPGLAVEIP